MSKSLRSRFALAFRSLTPDRRSELDALIRAWYERTPLLSKRDRWLMLNDLRGSVLCLFDLGVPFDEALRRLSPDKLGEFYRERREEWFPLDNAAKIYPMTANNRKMAVFRVSVYLTRTVRPELLRTALAFAVRRFPHFTTGVRCGFFWHYLDRSVRRFEVSPDADVPCRRLNVSPYGSPPFRVSFFANRISADFFHLLTDGTGGLLFIKTLAAEYLRLLGAEVSEFPTDVPALGRELSNDFLYVPPARPAGFADRPALQLSGKLTLRQPARVLHFAFSADALHALARKNGTTVTVLTLAMIFRASAMSSEGDGSIQIQVPINLRKYYGSETLRNFSLFCNIRIPKSSCFDVLSLIPEISAQLSAATARETLDAGAAMTNRLVRLLRFVPLALKRPAARAVYGILGEKVFTTTLSNLGAVVLPDSMKPYVEGFDFVLGNAGINRAACALISYGGRAVLSVTKNTDNPAFELALERIAGALGLETDISGSV